MRAREEVVAGDLPHERHGQVGVGVDAARHHQLAARIQLAGAGGEGLRGSRGVACRAAQHKLVAINAALMGDECMPTPGPAATPAPQPSCSQRCLRRLLPCTHLEARPHSQDEPIPDQHIRLKLPVSIHHRAALQRVHKERAALVWDGWCRRHVAAGRAAAQMPAPLALIRWLQGAARSRLDQDVLCQRPGGRQKHQGAGRNPGGASGGHGAAARPADACQLPRQSA